MENDAIFVMLATPGREKKAPENANEEGDTVSDADRPTEIDPSEIIQETQKNPTPKPLTMDAMAKKMTTTSQRRTQGNPIPMELHREKNKKVNAMA